MIRILEAGKWKKRRFTLGRLGEAVDDDILDLKEARQRARLMIEAATDGRNPQGSRPSSSD